LYIRKGSWTCCRKMSEAESMKLGLDGWAK
jgi:hypothetical protein